MRVFIVIDLALQMAIDRHASYVDWNVCRSSIAYQFTSAELIMAILFIRIIEKLLSWTAQIVTQYKRVLLFQDSI